MHCVALWGVDKTFESFICCNDVNVITTMVMKQKANESKGVNPWLVAGVMILVSLLLIWLTIVDMLNA